MNKCQFYCNYIGSRARSAGGGGGASSWVWDPEAAWQDIVDTCASNAGKAYTDTVTRLNLGASSSSSNHHMSLVLTATGDIYYLPGAANNIVKIDPTIDTITTVGDFSSLGDGIKCFGGVFAPNGCIYSASSTNAFMKLDTNNNSMSTIPIQVTGYRCGTLAPNNSIYFPPYNCSKVYKLSTSNDTVSKLPSYIDDAYFISSVLAPNGNIYAVSDKSYGTEHVLKIDTTTDTFTIINDAYGKQYTSCVLAPSGCIYCTSRYSNLPILKINTVDDTITPIYLTSPDWVYNSGSLEHSKSVLAPNGCIYSICVYTSDKYYTYRYALFKLDTVSDTYTYSQTALDANIISSISSLSNAILGFNGCIYIADNYKTNNIFKIDPGSSVNTNFQTNTLLSPYLNKY